MSSLSPRQRSALMQSPDLARWRSFSERYLEAVGLVATRKKKEDLPADEQWLSGGGMRNELKTKGLSPSILKRVMRWKLARGKMRPLMRFMDALKEEECSRVWEDLKTVQWEPGEEPQEVYVSSLFDPLKRLKGVGEAFASSFWSSLSGGALCMMSDEALLQCGLPLQYSRTNYEALLRALRNKAEQLSTPEDHWTPGRVERALWAEEALAGERGRGKRKQSVQKDDKRKRNRK